MRFLYRYFFIHYLFINIFLTDVAPVFKYTFEASKVEPGTALSLKCIAAGNPLPQVTWTLDDLPIPDHMRFSVGDYVTSRAEVVSFVNISTLRVEDGGKEMKIDLSLWRH